MEAKQPGVSVNNNNPDKEKEVLEEESVSIADNNSLGLPNEILEYIFAYLPTRDVLAARSVCKSWVDIGNQLLMNAHLPKIKINITGLPSSNVKAFLACSNASSSPFFQHMQHFILEGDCTDFDDDKVHYDELLTKYSTQIKCIELEDYCDEELTVFLLDKRNLGKLVSLQCMKISGNVSLKFLKSEAFDVTLLTRLSSLEFGPGDDLEGQNNIITILSQSKAKNELKSIMLGGASSEDCELNLSFEILGGLFHNSPKLTRFHSSSSGFTKGARHCIIDSSHLHVMTSFDGGCKLTDLKIMIKPDTLDLNTFHGFLKSHSSTLESLSIHYKERFSFLQEWILDIPRFPSLKRLELSSCPSTMLLARMPNLLEFRISNAASEICLDEILRVQCRSLTSLEIEFNGYDYTRLIQTHTLKPHMDFVQNVTSCFPNLEHFSLQVNVFDMDTIQCRVWVERRLELSLNRSDVDTLFQTSPAMEQIYYSELQEGDVRALESLENFMEVFVDIVSSNCLKFITLHWTDPMNFVPTPGTICLLSHHGFSFNDMERDAVKSLETNRQFGKYGFIKLISPSSLLPIYAIGPRYTSRPSSTGRPSNNIMVLF